MGQTSSTLTWLAAGGYAVGYVLPLHIVQGSRNDERVIKARCVTVVAMSGLLGLIPTYLALQSAAGPLDWVSWSEVLEAVGFQATGAGRGVLTGAGLVLCLFAGPLAFAATQTAAGQPPALGNWYRTRLQALRDLALAPVSEELVFRGGLLSFMLARGVGPGAATIAGLSAFSAAHLHHMLDHMRHMGCSPQAATVAAAIQAAYTSVFGLLASGLWLKTGSLAGPVAAHVLCNALGLPPLGRMRAAPGGPWFLGLTALGVAGFGWGLASLWRR